MSMDFTDDKLTLIMVMAWCVVAPSHYLSQCWPRSMLWYAITRPQRVKDVVHPKTFVFVLNSALISANFTYIIQGHFTNTGAITWLHLVPVYKLRQRQNGRHFADSIFKCIFLNENVWITIKFSMKFVPKGPINNIPALVQIMAWRRPGDKPLSEPMMVRLLTHICVTRPQWVNMKQL